MVDAMEYKIFVTTFKSLSAIALIFNLYVMEGVKFNFTSLTKSQQVLQLGEQNATSDGAVNVTDNKVIIVCIISEPPLS